VHGFNSIASKLDVDILLSGLTGVFSAYEAGGKYFINPGSVDKSFVLMDITVLMWLV
jgi:predicted phosphodiesterase